MRYPILLLFCGCVTAFSAEESAFNLASHFRSRPLAEITMANLPKGRENEVIDQLVKSRADATLLRLNHLPTIQKIMGAYEREDGRSAFIQRIIGSSGSPYIIDELAPFLYVEDGIGLRSYGEHADMDWGLSAASAGLLGKIILRAPEFPSIVKEWAERELIIIEYQAPNPNLIQAARAWWELNQAALLANQFDKVQVPASYPAGIPPEQPAQQLATPPAPIAPTPEPPAPVAPPPPAPTPEPVKSSIMAAAIPTPAAEPAPATKSNPVWWIVGLIILAAGVVFVVRKKRPQA